jgi:hypothetical protein
MYKFQTNVKCDPQDEIFTHKKINGIKNISQELREQWVSRTSSVSTIEMLETVTFKIRDHLRQPRHPQS